MMDDQESNIEAFTDWRLRIEIWAYMHLLVWRGPHHHHGIRLQPVRA